jgi:hypothetical protein
VPEFFCNLCGRETFNNFNGLGEVCMIRKINKHVLRILGIIIWLCGLLLPWSTFNFEPWQSSVLLTGWEEILIGIETCIETLKDGYDIYILACCLESLGIILLVAYIIYAVFSIKKEFMGRKLLGALLTGIVIVNILFMQIVITGRILLGFWIFMTGLLLCIIVEWINE